MAETKLATLVVCPGRGTYNKGELGYLKRLHPDKGELLATVDRLRAERGEVTVSELDGAARFDPATYSRGDVASPLIFACSYADFLSIDRSRHDIVAVTGNSMGWYTALACAGAVDLERGFGIVNGMGEISQQGEPGGQLLITLVGEDWRPVDGLREQVMGLVEAVGERPGCALHVSIELGGMVVLAGNDEAFDALLAELPETPGRQPMRLANHGPFHSPMMHASAERAAETFPRDWFAQPAVPLIDGRGHVWRPHASNIEALWRYTFTTQILETYHFTKALQVAVREFAPDCIVLLGPGDTLGGAIAQALIGIDWRGLGCKSQFQERQAAEPILLAMSREDQRAAVVRGQ